MAHKWIQEPTVQRCSECSLMRRDDGDGRWQYCNAVNTTWSYEALPCAHVKSILQDWVQELGLRHQGVLLTVVRGCDTVSRDHLSKKLTRAFRAEILNAHVGDPKKSASFIEVLEEQELINTMRGFCSDLDQYPLHFVMHFAHAAEVIAYCHPSMQIASQWAFFYKTICKKLHVNPETEVQLSARLDADEQTFKIMQSEVA